MSFFLRQLNPFSKINYFTFRSLTSVSLFAIGMSMIAPDPRSFSLPSYNVSDCLVLLEHVPAGTHTNLHQLQKLMQGDHLVKPSLRDPYELAFIPVFLTCLREALRKFNKEHVIKFLRGIDYIINNAPQNLNLTNFLDRETNRVLSTFSPFNLMMFNWITKYALHNQTYLLTSFRLPPLPKLPPTIDLSELSSFMMHNNFLKGQGIVRTGINASLATHTGVISIVLDMVAIKDHPHLEPMLQYQNIFYLDRLTHFHRTARLTLPLNVSNPFGYEMMFFEHDLPAPETSTSFVFASLMLYSVIGLLALITSRYSHLLDANPVSIGLSSKPILGATIPFDRMTRYLDEFQLLINRSFHLNIVFNTHIPSPLTLEIVVSGDLLDLEISRSNLVRIFLKTISSNAKMEVLDELVRGTWLQNDAKPIDDHLFNFYMKKWRQQSQYLLECRQFLLDQSQKLISYQREFDNWCTQTRLKGRELNQTKKLRYENDLKKLEELVEQTKIQVQDAGRSLLSDLSQILDGNMQA